MNARYLRSTLLAAVAVLAVGTGCGSDVSSADTVGPGGVSSMTVSGDVEGTFQGYATYTDASLELGYFALGLTDNRSFSLDLTIAAPDNAPPPEGRYTISSGYGSDKVQATFNQFQEGSFMNPAQYPAAGATAGVLEITESSPAAVVATFEFNAQDKAGNAITLTHGSFHAKQVAGGIQQ